MLNVFQRKCRSSQPTEVLEPTKVSFSATSGWVSHCISFIIRVSDMPPKHDGSQSAPRPRYSGVQARVTHAATFPLFPHLSRRWLTLHSSCGYCFHVREHPSWSIFYFFIWRMTGVIELLMINGLLNKSQSQMSISKIKWLLVWKENESLSSSSDRLGQNYDQVFSLGTIYFVKS